MRASLVFLCTCLILAPAAVEAQPASARTPPPARSRFTLYLPVGMTVWRRTGATNTWLWEQPTVNEQLALGWRLGRNAPYELRGALLFGQRLDTSLNAVGALLAFVWLPRPFMLGAATVVLTKIDVRTDVGFAVLFGVGGPLGRGFGLAFGGQIAVYPFGTETTTTLVLGPGLSYQLP